ncbi:hypothetical protein HPP92_023922 [Vanilla planifolia]|uniref:Mediator of RNA polymerase II transcription subunit 25 von Willebrand factor type A domain-containing protein n=1 Tax=Vanilla planifolia TaxID=51239 RepID=A0A835PR02_VANPL|nr:hypothetical protein HPP92_023922 [Vanilla planifolia]
MADKQLILVVEGTAALGPYWVTLVTEYIEKIIRCGLSSHGVSINLYSDLFRMIVDNFLLVFFMFIYFETVIGELSEVTSPPCLMERIYIKDFVRWTWILVKELWLLKNIVIDSKRIEL